MYFQGALWRKVNQQMIKVLNGAPALTGGKLIVALSGGMDSVFLLAALCQIKRKYHFKLLPVHIDHRLESEARLFSGIAKKLALKFNLGFETLTVGKRPRRRNLEDWLREERYRLLEKRRRKENVGYIAVAHHQSDQAETVLAHIIRGAGIQGLKGMLPIRGKIIRPLLYVSKKDITALMHSTNLPYYNDRLNYSRDYQRNKIRHELIPFMEKELNPQITSRLAKLAENLQRIAKY
ncbi:MAG: tRNA lysidine(34) synthetase TilS [Candidatus Moranbacteria bacterium]|nr:tRNA lysidine(34) synthetase TilS [Candidatus Moranbacteria bacterium]